MSDIKRALLTLLAWTLLAAADALAQETHPSGHGGHGGATQPTPTPEPDPGSPLLPEGRTLDEMLDYAAKPPPASFGPPLHDDAVFTFTQFELLEYRVSDTGRDELGWDAQGWIGTDEHKFWWKSEGDAVFEGPDEGTGNVQALYAVPISPFWYLQVGAELELAWNPDDTHDRVSAVLGLQGVAPFQWDMEPALFLTDDGDVLGQLTALYNLYLTQRLILQPRAEIAAAAQDVPELGLGAGFTGGQFDLRLLYEVRREFAPYVGVRYDVLFGETGDIAERDGEKDHDWLLLVGARLNW